MLPMNSLTKSSPQILGPSVIAGLVVMIVLIPVNGISAAVTRKLQVFTQCFSRTGALPSSLASFVSKNFRNLSFRSK